MPHHLSQATHELARRALAGEHGRSMRAAEFGLDEAGDLQGVSGNMRYAHSARLIAERAPLRIEAGERIVGSATLLEAARHTTPVLGNRSTSHTTLGFDRVLPMGYRGLRRETEDRLARGGLDPHGVDLLQAMLMCLDAAATWHGRHLALLDHMAASTSGQERLTLTETRAALAPVPGDPPATFHQAVQSLWFMFAFQRLLGTWSGVGRIDEMLGPYLRKDLDAGVITLDDAREILAHLWIKGCEWIGVPNSGGGSGDAQFYQNIILSGMDAAGRSVTNEVTYLVLDVVEELLISDFPIAVRISPRTPPRLLRRVAQVQRRGGGIVAVYNEDMVIRALVRFGYPEAEARTFTNDGCWEVIVPGRTNFSYRPFDVLQLLQDTLGVSPDVGPPADYPTFEGLYSAFVCRLEAHLERFHHDADGFANTGNPAPLVSAFVQDCIENGRGYYDRGARYNVCAPHAGGLPDTANALAAIKALVYDERELSLPEFVAILRSDWAGHEALRRRVRNQFPMYGNDCAAADQMVRRLFDDYVALAGRVPERNGVKRPAGLSTFGRQIQFAKQRGATAAGTQRGDVLSNNFSPAPGTDRSGPTAVVKSFCSVDFERLPNGTALDLKLMPSGLEHEAGLAGMVSLMRTFVTLGGWFMHVDVVDADTLREAQRHPDRFPNLAVRISGWSARFATLNREWQDMIIERTAHSVQ